MLRLFSTALFAALLFTSCKKSGDDNGGGCNLPSSAAPAGLVSGWVNGFTNFTQIKDVYNGQVLGTTWSSAKYFKFTANGKDAEFYYAANGQFSRSATYAQGSVKFDDSSTADEGSFTFYACQAHFKGWGSTPLDRDATREECDTQLTKKYFYRMEGQWLRIEPGGAVNSFSSSFRATN